MASHSCAANQYSTFELQHPEEIGGTLYLYSACSHSFAIAFLPLITYQKTLKAIKLSLPLIKQAIEMKHLLAIVTCCFLSFIVSAQQHKFSGTWEGDLKAGMQTLRLVFTVSENEQGVTKLTMQSPQQSAMHLPADSVITDVDKISFEMKKFNISFSGKLINDTIIEGEFKQGVPFPLQLKKVERASVISKPKRPQTPKPPYSYKSIDVTFSNKDNSLLFGATLTLPDTIAGKKYPAVVLISGSGPQDRDETIFGHKPFAVIADYLTKKGFAVLRVDDRGVAKSTGNFAKATSADFANDTEAALDYLKQHANIDSKKVGLIGHSEGGQIAPMVAAKRKDVKFIVLLAGPGIKGIDILTTQNVAIFKSNGMSATAAEAYGGLYKPLIQSIINAPDSATGVSNAKKVLREWKGDDSLKQLFKIATEADQAAFAETMASQVYNPWFRYFVSYDPAPALKKLKCAVLAINGSKDLQVLPAENLAGIKKALQKSKSKNYEVVEIANLNHLFQTCNTCTLDEYANLEESFSPEALEIINNWLQAQVK